MRTGYIYLLLSTLVLGVLFSMFIVATSPAEYMTAGGWLFHVAAAFTHAALFTLVPFVLCCLLMQGLLHLERLGRALHIGLIALLDVFFLVDMFIFRLYRFHVNGFILGVVTGPGASQIYNFDAALYLQVVLYGLLIVAVNVLLYWLSERLQRRLGSLHVVVVAVGFVLVTLVAHLTHAWADAVRYTPVVKAAATLPYYFPLTANTLLTKLGLISHDRGAVEMRLDHSNSGVRYPIAPIQVDSVRVKRYNIVHILLDSWNHRTQQREEIPHISAFADSCQVFAHHRSSSNGTRSSLFGMFFGIYPTYWEDFEVQGIRPVLVTEMIKQGYQINVYPASSFKSPNFNEVIFGDVPGGVETDTEGAGVWDYEDNLTRNALAHLDTIGRSGRPFYALLFYDAPHAGCAPPDNRCRFRPYAKFMDYIHLTNETDPTPYYNMYRNAVCYDDSLVGCVLDKLRERDLLRNTVVIITGDHSQEFNDTHHNYWGHSATYTEAQTAVPFFLYMPGEPPARYEHATTHYDVAPTLLSEVFGVTNPLDEYSVGHLLTDTVSRRWHLMGNELNFAFAVDGYVLEKKPAGNVEVTDEMMNPVGAAAYDPGELLEALRDINRFYK